MDTETVVGIAPIASTFVLSRQDLCLIYFSIKAVLQGLFTAEVN